jgi:prepilin signal peptidase PulO-like enzyme (type II secretory pathway)
MEPLSWHTVFAIGVCGWLAGWDIRYRVAPNWITLPSIAVGIIVGGKIAIMVAIITWLIMDYAQFPAGDCKGAAAMAAWVPWQTFAPAFAATFIVTLLIMETGWYNLYHVAHRWAWLAGLSLALTISAICRMLIGA